MMEGRAHAFVCCHCEDNELNAYILLTLTSNNKQGLRDNVLYACMHDGQGGRITEYCTVLSLRYRDL